VTTATPDNAAAFLGDWTLSTTGSNGTTAAALSIKVEAGKVTAEITAEAQGRVAITDIRKSGLTLILSYGFDYQGMAVPVVLTLAPAAEKITATFDYAKRCVRGDRNRRQKRNSRRPGDTPPCAFHRRPQQRRRFLLSSCVVVSIATDPANQPMRDETSGVSA